MAPDRKLAQYQAGPVNFQNTLKTACAKTVDLWREQKITGSTPQQEEENLPSSLHSQLHSQYCLGVIAFNFIWFMLNMQKKENNGKKTLTPCLLSSFSSGPLHRSKLVCSSRSFCRFSPKLLNKKQNKGKKRNMSDTPGNLSISQTPNIGACISGALTYCTFGTSRNLQVLLNYIKLCFLRSVCNHFLKVIAHA